MDNYKNIVQDIRQTAIQCKRNPQDIQLVAVTKGISWDRASALYDQGHRDFAENRLNEALEKQAEARPDCRWHLIGTLQSNKVRKAIGRFVLIHSVDSLELARKISHHSQEAGIVTSILLQVNTSGELSKHGMTPEECQRDYGIMLDLPSISIQGLMTIAPLVENDKIIRNCFAGLRNLRDYLNERYLIQAPLRHLSMGMSHDYKLAISEGATMVRIGTAIFPPEKVEIDIDEPVIITPFNPKWPQEYLDEKNALMSHLKNSIKGIEHIGSTAVPGLDAKPIIDIMIGIGSYPPAKEWIRQVEDLGYNCFGEAGVPGRLYFTKRGKVKFNLAVVEFEGRHWINNLKIRNYLQTHPKAALEYSRLKAKALQVGADTLLQYSQFKERFLQNLLKD